ncbi:hypothetical protein [Cellulomonas sp. Marseille-Q8402]
MFTVLGMRPSSARIAGTIPTSSLLRVEHPAGGADVGLPHRLDLLAHLPEQGDVRVGHRRPVGPADPVQQAVEPGDDQHQPLLHAAVQPLGDLAADPHLLVLQRRERQARSGGALRGLGDLVAQPPLGQHRRQAHAGRDPRDHGAAAELGHDRRPRRVHVHVEQEAGRRTARPTRSPRR